MTKKLVRIANFASQTEAEHAASKLQELGINAFVEGGAVATALSHVGSALGGVKLLTQASDVDRAQEALARWRPVDADDWYCAACDETLAASFEICWSCGKLRADVAGEPPQQEQAEERRPLRAASRDLTNPYVASNVSESLPSTNTAEALVARAHRLACIGTFTLPGILHLYSLTLLVRATWAPEPLSPRSHVLWMTALLINLANLVFWPVFVYFVLTGQA